MAIFILNGIHCWYFPDTTLTACRLHLKVPFKHIVCISLSNVFHFGPFEHVCFAVRLFKVLHNCRLWVVYFNDLSNVKLFIIVSGYPLALSRETKWQVITVTIIYRFKPHRGVCVCTLWTTAF